MLKPGIAGSSYRLDQLSMILQIKISLQKRIVEGVFLNLSRWDDFQLISDIERLGGGPAPGDTHGVGEGTGAKIAKIVLKR